MTNDQEEILRSMTRAEISMKYAPMLAAGKITNQQFDYVLKFADTKFDAGNSSTQRSDRNNGQLEDGVQRQETIEDNSENHSQMSHNESDGIVRDLLECFGGRETTHTEIKEGLSQKARLLAILHNYKTHTTPDLLEKVYGDQHLGIARLAARINDLKKDGYLIESKKQGKSVWSYRLAI